MAHKDYVKRKPAPRKKKAPQKASKPPLAKFKVTLALLVLIGFASGIYYLSTFDSHNLATPSAVSEKTTVVEGTKTFDVDPLPELPEEEYKFFEALEGYEVQVNVQAIESDKRYLMQCGSFREFGQADEMRAQMAFVGLEPQIRGSQNGWYRVVLGPYESKRRAEKDRHTLQNVNINSCQIWLWNL